MNLSSFQGLNGTPAVWKQYSTYDYRWGTRSVLPGSASQCQCPNKWVTFQGSCYFFGHGNGMTFSKAEVNWCILCAWCVCINVLSKLHRQYSRKFDFKRKRALELNDVEVRRIAASIIFSLILSINMMQWNKEVTDEWSYLTPNALFYWKTFKYTITIKLLARPSHRNYWLSIILGSCFQNMFKSWWLVDQSNLLVI